MPLKPKRPLVGREPAKAKLDRLLESGEPEFLAVYGRRRVGKTYLIRQYLAEHIVFDVSGIKDASLTEQLLNFHTELVTRTKGKTKEEPPSSWLQAFFNLTDYLAQYKNSDKKIVVFIDEMPWFDTPKSSFITGLESFWNQHGSRMDNLILIACGSASSWMLKKLIHNRGGLYNRVTQRLKLQPFNLHETELFLQSMKVKLTQYQVIELYMAMGGIPHYLKEAESGKTAAQLIDDICLSPKGLLNDEYAQLYESLFKNAENHVAIVEALAKHPMGMVRNDIAKASKLAEGTLSRTLEELLDCDFISKYPPLFNKKKDAVYKLTDLYSLFYIKFIEPNKRATKFTWLQLSSKPAYTAWSGYAFETICMMHINEIKAALGIAGVFTYTGSWVHHADENFPGAQVDMIIDRADGMIHLCEAKFTKESFVIEKAYAEKLRNRKGIFDQVNKLNKPIVNTLFSSWPAVKNMYYLEQISSEVSMDKLFVKLAE